MKATAPYLPRQRCTDASPRLNSLLTRWVRLLITRPLRLPQLPHRKYRTVDPGYPLQIAHGEVLNA